MGERVYSQTEDNRHRADALKDQYSQSRVVTDIKKTVWVSDRKVCIAVSSLVVGRPRGEDHKDKRYYKWGTTASLGFYRNRAGMAQPYHASRPWDFKKGTPWTHRTARSVFEWLEGDDDLSESFRHHCWEVFGIRELGDIYPVTDLWPVVSYKYIPYSLRPAFRENNWNDFAGRIFGKKRNSQRLQAAVSNTDPYIVAYAQAFRGLVPDADLLSFIENTHFDDEMMEAYEGQDVKIRGAVKAMDQKSRNTILARGLDLSDIQTIQSLSQHSLEWQKRLVSGREEFTSWNGLLTW